jgi:hydrogenase-4 component B
MTLWTGPALPLFTLIWPLMLGALCPLPALRPHALRLLPLAPLPALALAVVGFADTSAAPILLMGVVLTGGAEAMLLLAMTAAVWTAAGVFAQGMSGGRHGAVFAGFWCLTLAGNLGVFLAADVVTFYVAFAAVSLAAYVLVVHDRTEKALHAGRVYITLAILGEACLLFGFTIGAAAADSLLISEIRLALADAPLGGLAIALLLAGFGLKAGMIPLHLWLPLAHPAAPVAASAVLSGAMVKAGLIGLILFLPAGAGADMLLVLGVTGAFAAALYGLTQTNPKTVLAYSTISQMGLILAVVGAGGGTVAAYYAAHHGLAKGALFLSVGLVMVSGGRWRWAAITLAAVVALSVAGAPLTGGALVKMAAKPTLPGWAELALTLSAVTTSLILLHFLRRLTRLDPGPDAPPWHAALPPLALALGALVWPWFLWDVWAGLPADYPVRTGALTDAVWPIAVALAAALGWRLLPARLPHAPEGDLIVPILRLPVPKVRLPELPPLPKVSLEQITQPSERLETALRRWPVAALAIVALGATLVLV